MSVHQYEHRSLGAPPEQAPRLEDIPFTTHGLDPDRVRGAFEAYECQLSWYRSRHGTVLPAFPAEPAGIDLRADAMRLVRAAVEFADIVERDAQEVACRQVEQVSAAIQQREFELEARESTVRAELAELERRRASMIRAARSEAEEIVTAAMRESTELRREAEAVRLRVAEECRHHATDLAHASRADVERTLEWARAHAEAIVRRGRAVSEQLISASLRGQADMTAVMDAIVRAAETDAGRPSDPVAGPAQTALPAGPEVSRSSESSRMLWSAMRDRERALGGANPQLA
jgi:cell division septum initiation protein DivIVA